MRIYIAWARDSGRGLCFEVDDASGQSNDTPLGEVCGESLGPYYWCSACRTRFMESTHRPRVSDSTRYYCEACAVTQSVAAAKKRERELLEKKRQAARGVSVTLRDVPKADF